MSNLSEQPAFPEIEVKVDPLDRDKLQKVYIPGMTYRQWLAGMAMQGLLACNALYDGKEDSEKLTKDAVKHADALIKELEK